MRVFTFDESPDRLLSPFSYADAHTLFTDLFTHSLTMGGLLTTQPNHPQLEVFKQHPLAPADPEQLSEFIRSNLVRLGALTLAAAHLIKAQRNNLISIHDYPTMCEWINQQLASFGMDRVPLSKPVPDNSNPFREIEAAVIAAEIETALVEEAAAEENE